jgi:hypothetical protein
MNPFCITHHRRIDRVAGLTHSSYRQLARVLAKSASRVGL